MEKKKRIRDRGPLESAIQMKVCEYLQSKELFFWRSNNIPVFATGNNGIGKFRSLPKFTPRGIPDIMLLHNFDFIGIEVKRPDMPLRPEQEAFGKKIAANGGLYWVIHSVEELDARLAILGI